MNRLCVDKKEKYEYRHDYALKWQCFSHLNLHKFIHYVNPQRKGHTKANIETSFKSCRSKYIHRKLLANGYSFYRLINQLHRNISA